MKIATWNVNGVRARHAQLAEFIEEYRPDVLCLQEIKAKPEQVPAALCELEGYSCYWHGAGGYSGVGLHLRSEAFPHGVEFSHPPFDHETRVVQARSGETIFASVYVPNGGKDFVAKMQFLAEMERYVAKTLAAGFELVLCGDLNVTRSDIDLHQKERKPGVIGQREDEREMIERILATGLTDVGRALDPDNENLFTWWAPWRNLRQRNIGWRLDYVLASGKMAKRARSSRVLREFGTSDHGPVLVELED